MKPTYLQLHKALFVPAVGDLGKRTLSQQFFPGIAFETHPYGVIANWKQHQFLIPWGEIECMGVEPKASPKVKDVQKS